MGHRRNRNRSYCNQVRGARHTKFPPSLNTSNMMKLRIKNCFKNYSFCQIQQVVCKFTPLLNRVTFLRSFPCALPAIPNFDFQAHFFAIKSFQNVLNGRRIYPFNKGLQIYEGVHHPPFDTLKKCTSTYDMNLKLYRQ